MTTQRQVTLRYAHGEEDGKVEIGYRTRALSVEDRAC